MYIEIPSTNLTQCTYNLDFLFSHIPDQINSANCLARSQYRLLEKLN